MEVAEGLMKREMVEGRQGRQVVEGVESGGMGEGRWVRSDDAPDLLLPRLVALWLGGRGFGNADRAEPKGRGPLSARNSGQTREAGRRGRGGGAEEGGDGDGRCRRREEVEDEKEVGDVEEDIGNERDLWNSKEFTRFSPL